MQDARLATMSSSARRHRSRRLHREGTGDGVHAAFVRAAMTPSRPQRRSSALAGARPALGRPRVRMGIHSGEAELRDGDTTARSPIAPHG